MRSPKPTIDELEEILTQEGQGSVEILPSGEIVAGQRVKKTSREVIEGKLLDSLDDDGTVAILASRVDLRRLITALSFYGRMAYLTQEETDDVDTHRRDFERLRNKAFGG